MALLSYVLIWSVNGDADTKLAQLLGPRVELKDSLTITSEDAIPRFAFSLTTSSKELGRTDFEFNEEPMTIPKEQRHFVATALRNYLDHVGEVYSPPRVTLEARHQGLRGQIALDLSTGWNFARADHRRMALDLIAKRRPAILLLSPPCTTFSPLRRLSDHKRDIEVVLQERADGELRMNFSIMQSG